VNTGGGGFHLYYMSPGVPVKGRNGPPGYRGIDIKGDDGYVVLPPSNHVSGKRYEWDMSTTIGAIPILPQSVIDLTEKERLASTVKVNLTAWDGNTPTLALWAMKSRPDIVDRFNGVPNAQGDTSESGTDFSVACKLAVFGLSGEEIGNTLRASWKQRGLANRDTGTYLQATVEKALAFAEKSRKPPAIPHPEEKQPGDEIMHWVRDARRIRDIAIANPEHVHAAYGIFEVGQWHVLAGKSSVGKSALAIWFGAHWAEGKVPMGMQNKPPKNGVFVYVGLDPSLNELVHKLHVYQRNLDKLQAISDPDNFGAQADYLVRGSVHEGRLKELRLDEDSKTRWVELIEELKKDAWPKDPESVVPFVVVDSFAKFMPEGSREIDNVAISDMADILGEVARTTKSVVLVLHHTSKAELATSFENMDVLGYARGGTGLMASARVKMGLAYVENTRDQFIGLKQVANNRPPPDDMFFRVNDGKSLGIHYWEPVPREEVEALQKQVKEEQQKASAEREREKAEDRLKELVEDAGAILEKVYAGGATEVSKARFYEVLATRDGVKPDSSTNRERADAFIDRCEQQGRLRVQKVGSGRGGRYVITRLV